MDTQKKLTNSTNIPHVNNAIKNAESKINKTLKKTGSMCEITENRGKLLARKKSYRSEDILQWLQDCVIWPARGKKNSRMYSGGHLSFALFLPPPPTNLLHGKDTRTYKKSPSWGSLRSSWVIREDDFLCTSISLTIFIQTPFTHIDVCVSTRSNKQIWKEARERINKYFGFKKVINQKIRWANR